LIEFVTGVEEEDDDEPFTSCVLFVRDVFVIEAGSWKLGAGSWKLEAGSWKLEAGSWKLGAR